jgi:hypothetical protein
VGVCWGQEVVLLCCLSVRCGLEFCFLDESVCLLCLDRRKASLVPRSPDLFPGGKTDGPYKHGTIRRPAVI